MLITAVTSAANTGGSTTGVNFTLTSPTGTTTGDVLVILVAERSNTEKVTGISDGSGHNFTSLRFGAQATTAATSIWYRVVGASDGTTWTVTNTGNVEACIMAYRGVDNTTPIDAQGTTNTTSSNSATFNAVTTTKNGAWFVGAFAANLSTNSNLTILTAGSPSPNKRADQGNGGATSTKQAVSLVDVGIATAGSSGAFSYTVGTSNNWATDTFALRPAADTTVPTMDTSLTGFNSSGSNANLFTSAYSQANNPTTTVMPSGFDIVVGVAMDSGSATISTITDTQSNTYTLLAGPITSGSLRIWLYVAYNATGGSGFTVEVTEGASVDGQIIAQFWTGLVTSSILDASHSDSGTSANPTTSGSLSTNDTNELIVSFLMLQSQTNTYSAGSGFSNLNNVASNFTSAAMESEFQASAGSYTASFGMTNTGTSYVQLTAGLLTTASVAAGGLSPGIKVFEQAVNRGSFW